MSAVLDPPRSRPATTGDDRKLVRAQPGVSVLAELSSYLPVAAGLTLIAASLGRIRLEDIDALGLFSVLPVSYWCGLAAIWLGFALALRHENVVSATALVHVVALVVALTVVPIVVPEHPRFPTAWTHVGFIDHILATGSVETGFDARFSWPGAFSLGAYLTELLGADSARALLRWTPMVMNLLLVPPLWLLANAVAHTARQRWSIVWFALALNWVGQDYLAPQSLGFLFYVTVLAVLLNLSRPSAGAPRWWDVLGRLDRRWPQLVRSGSGVQLERAPSIGAGPVYVLALLLAMSLVVSHQLTPFVLAGALLVMALTGRLDNIWLAVVVLVATLAWLFLGASAYLEGHLDQLVAEFGRIGDSVGGGVTDRFAPGAQRQIVLFSRIGLTAMLLFAGVIGFVIGWRRDRADWTTLGLATFPFGLLAASSYGGELVLRIAMFTMPFLVALAVSTLVPRRVHRPAVWVGAVMVVGVLLSPAVVLARYGNESFERTRPEDVALWGDLVADAPDDAMVVVPNFAGPWRYTDLIDVYYRVYADEVGGPPDVESMNELVDEQPGSYVLIGAAARDYEEIAQGLAPDWADAFVEDLIASGYEVVSRRGDGVLLRRIPQDD